MGSLYRSEHMSLCQIFLQAETAYDCLGELGELGAVQFNDLNNGVNAFQRKYVNEVRRCDEMERELRYFEKEMVREEIPIFKIHPNELSGPPAPREMSTLEDMFHRMELELREINTNEETLRENYMELIELKHADKISRKQKQALNRQPNISEISEESQSLLSDLYTDSMEDNKMWPLFFMAGVINHNRMLAFERLLWRVCRGNIFLKWEPIDEILEDPHTRDPVKKCVFVIFFQGEQLKQKVKKICESFRSKIYPCPNTPNERQEMCQKVNTRIEDIKTILGESTDHRRKVLQLASQNLRDWENKVHKIKAIYYTMNLLSVDVTAKCLVAECWVPKDDLDAVREALRAGDVKGSETEQPHLVSILNPMETQATPPTFFRTNKFTKGFQNIVDSYGMATYREINPAPWTIITFPFLYAVMFGDLGHGMIMFLFALALVLGENKLKHLDLGDIFEMIFGGRYVILLMGAFAMYTGLVYNDCYSKSLDIFGSGWKIPVNTTNALGDNDYDYTRYQNEWWPGSGNTSLFVELDPALAAKPDAAYWFGMDPIWNLAENKLLFLDSFKMKMSVLLGISQMTFGVMLSLLNFIYFKDRIRILFEYIPAMMFLGFLFIYLCILILVKWFAFSVFPYDFGGPIGYYAGPHCAPSLLIGFINTVMLKSLGQEYGFSTENNGTYTDKPNCNLNAWYPGQTIIEPTLVVTAMLAIPVMLLTRPLILYFRNRAATRAYRAPTMSSEEHSNPAYSPDPDPLPKKNGKLNGKTANGNGLIEAGSSSSESDDSAPAVQEDPNKFDFGDIFIYQAIHTIEFALGCISHTASYLRLWALSLAHSRLSHLNIELSDVLWTMLLRMGLQMSGKIAANMGDSMNSNILGSVIGGIIVFVFFTVFAVLTIAILILMEGLSAFLHALRLHWVEFQSKFYHGEGYAFQPFSFKTFDEAAHKAMTTTGGV